MVKLNQHKARRSHTSDFMRSNRSIALALVLVFAALALSIWFSDWAHRQLRDGFTLGGFPLFALGMVGISLIILIIDGQRRTVEPGMPGLRLATMIVVLCAVTAMAAFFLAMSVIGFVPSAALFIAAGSTALGYRPVWKAALTGLGAAIVIRVILGFLGVAIGDEPLLAVIGL